MIAKLIKAGLLVLLFSSVQAAAQSYPASQDQFVNDYADLLSPEQEDRVRSKLLSLFATEGIEFTVLTIQSMSDFGHSGRIEPFATGLFNEWGIGNAQRNDGLLLLVSKDDRVLRIEVGAGYEQNLDATMKTVIDETIVPHFRQDNYGRGIEAGVTETILQVTGRYPGEQNSSWFGRAYGAVKRTLQWIGGWIWLLLVPAIPLGGKAIRRWRRYRPRQCPVDGSQMRMFLEETEDEELNAGQITEERLNSVDHDVWFCPTCDHITIESYKFWFSSYGACRECGFRTVEGQSRIIQSATYSSSGQRETDYSCHHCKAEYSVISTIPRKTRSSSSSSRSGSGGRSSGGGASGSW